MSSPGNLSNGFPQRAFQWILLPVLFSILAFFLTLPLMWKDQAILGCLLIASALLAHRCLPNRVTTLFLSLTACFCTARYAYYRYSETLWNFRTSWSQIDLIDAGFVLLLLAAETYSFAILFLGCLQTARPLKRPPVPMPPDTDSWPTVDVFIPTYNEPLDVVTPTVLAALTMDYPKDKFRVFILDDGRRSAFEQLAKECGATYVTRLDNSHAKAGNINAALKGTSGEYVAIFDCDHVPTRSFLQMTMGGLIQDPKLAMVQTPHHFYSADPFERNLGIFRKVPNESALFYGLIQDGNDLWDATYFCGSCTVLRRTALEEIGGIAVETVTEDAHTALRMQALGWGTAYLNIPQAAGLATSRLADHIGQRIRWARGMVQILRIDNPLFKSGLRLPQRLCYLNSMVHYLFAGPRFIFFFSPLVYLLLGRSNVFGYLPGILAYGLPHIVLSTVMNSRVHGKYRHSFWNEVYEMVLAPYIFLPTLLALVNPKWGSFNVTAKDSLVEGTYFDWRITKPFLFLAVLNAAGIGLGVYRLIHDGDPQGVLAVNLTWCFFNMVILGGSLAVGNESRQLRSTVRVSSKLPIRVLIPGKEAVPGQTNDVSLGGLVARLVRSDVLRAGDEAEVIVMLGEEEYRFPVTATGASGSLVRLRFPDLSIEQQAMLTRVIFGRADTWLKWRNDQEQDRPLFNLLRIGVLALKGYWAALSCLVPKHKKKRRSVVGQEQVAVPTALIALLLVSAAPASAQLVSAPLALAPVKDAAAEQSSWFRDVRGFASLGHKQGIQLRNDRKNFTLHFALPMTKMVAEGGLMLRYRVSPLVARGSRVQVSLNGSSAATLSVAGNGSASLVQQSELVLAPELFVTDNTLAFDFEPICSPECRSEQSPDIWISLESSTEIRTAGTLMPMPNRLSFLPSPFLAPSSQRLVDIPFVLDTRSDAATKQAAGVVASWFGVKADSQAVRFPVSEGKFPIGNVVLLAVKDSPLAVAIGANTLFPSVSIHGNPNDPYGKVLVIAAESSKGLVQAARAFALERFSHEGDSSLLSISDLPAPRVPYDAPRWLDVKREIRLAEGMRDAELSAKGSGSVNLYFRLPPDLYYGTRDTVPFHLRYRASVLTEGSKAFVKVQFNGQQIATRAIPTEGRSNIHEEIVYLPVASIYPRNTLTVEFAFDNARTLEDSSRVPEAAVLKSSELMVQGRPHFAAMPRLDMFANTGFPFTRLADLSETLVLLAPEPTAEETSLLLTMAGFMGAQTGYPALRMNVAQTSTEPSGADKDMLLIGALNRQPLLQKWAPKMWIQPAGQRMQLAETFSLHGLLSKIPGLGPHRERQTLELILGSDSQVDGVVQGFQSPTFAKRSVVSFVAMPGKTLASLAEDWASAADASHLYGTASLFSDGQFHSFTLDKGGQQHLGNLDAWSAMQYWGRHYYWVAPIFIFACIWMLAIFSDSWLESVAAARLQPKS